MADLTASTTDAKLRDVALADLRFDGGTQIRAELDDDTVGDYAVKFAAGEVFPACVVYFDGSHYWLADGFHRSHAARRAGLIELLCEVRIGTKRDAILHAVGANAQHGKARTNADKRRAVEVLLNDPEWSGWSNREIARRAAVAHTTVNRIRPEPESLEQSSSHRTYVDRHGNASTMNTSNIGSKSKPAESVSPVAATAPAEIAAAPQRPQQTPPPEADAIEIAKPAKPITLTPEQAAKLIDLIEVVRAHADKSSNTVSLHVLQRQAREAKDYALEILSR